MACCGGNQGWLAALRFVVTQFDLCDQFRRLHAEGCFVMPNPWDVGSAIALSELCFPAIGTSSAGLCYSVGRPDSLTALSVDDALDHVSAVVGAVALPVSADFEAGYAADRDLLAVNVTRCVQTGVAGLSIEDATGEAAQPLYPLAEAVVRVQVARRAIDDAGPGVVLTARAESYLCGLPDPLADAITRLQAYADAGAEVLFAPGIKTPEDIATLVAAVKPYPVNVVMSSDTGMTVADLARLGVRRVSVGSALSRVAWGAFLQAARTLLGKGTFAGLNGSASFDELNALFGG